MFYTKNVLGVFAIDDGEVIAQYAFPDDPEDIAAKLGEKRCSEEQDLFEEHGEMEQRQVDAFTIGKDVGLIDTREELYRRQRAVAIAYTEDEIEASHSKDQLLVQAVRAIKDIDKTNNKSVERLRAWYGLYFPELDDHVDDHAAFASIVADHFSREEAAAAADIDPESTGMPIEAADRTAMQQFAGTVKDRLAYRDSLEVYVENLAERIAPNLSAVLGKLLAARIISEAGSLDKLSKMPSSTVQVLGAEKALFRHMRGEGSAPKHGILFMHRSIRNLPEGKRGKMARFLANKATIAARLDRFAGDYKGDVYRNQVDEKFEELQEA